MRRLLLLAGLALLATAPTALAQRTSSSEPLSNGRDAERSGRLAASARPANPHADGREPGQTILPKSPLVPTDLASLDDGREPGARPAFADARTEGSTADAAKTDVASTEITLGASAPNPVDRSARITFTLPRAATASLVLFDVRGREVATLFEGHAAAGTHAVVLDASGLAAGTYVYVLDVGGERQSRRLQVAH